VTARSGSADEEPSLLPNGAGAYGIFNQDVVDQCTKLPGEPCNYVKALLKITKPFSIGGHAFRSRFHFLRSRK
jgi:hypothetical protein